MIELPIGGGPIEWVEYLHRDGTCVWFNLKVNRGPGREWWSRNFNGKDEVITSASFAR